MARSTYLSANLTQPQIDLLLMLDDDDLNIFSLETVKKVGGRKFNNVKAAWKNSLGHQINPILLPEYEKVKESLKLLFERHF